VTSPSREAQFPFRPFFPSFFFSPISPMVVLALRARTLVILFCPPFRRITLPPSRPGRSFNYLHQLRSPLFSPPRHARPGVASSPLRLPPNSLFFAPAIFRLFQVVPFPIGIVPFIFYFVQNIDPLMPPPPPRYLNAQFVQFAGLNFFMELTHFLRKLNLPPIFFGCLVLLSAFVKRIITTSPSLIGADFSSLMVLCPIPPPFTPPVI